LRIDPLWLYLDAEVLVLPPVFLPQDSVFVGCRSSSSSNCRPPVPQFLLLCWCDLSRAGFLSFPALFPCVFLKVNLQASWEYPSPLYCLIQAGDSGVGGSPELTATPKLIQKRHRQVTDTHRCTYSSSDSASHTHSARRPSAAALLTRSRGGGLNTPLAHSHTQAHTLSYGIAAL